MCFIDSIGGAFKNQPEQLDERLSDRAHRLIDLAFQEIDSAKLIDHHTHIAGLGTSATGTFVHPKMRTWTHPLHHLKFRVYLSAAGVDDVTNADEQLVQRLVNLIKHMPQQGKHRLLAFDKHYNRDGSVNLAKTEFYVPNEYVFAVAEQYPDLFTASISVSPYRTDALAELERWASRGARVKW